MADKPSKKSAKVVKKVAAKDLPARDAVPTPTKSKSRAVAAKPDDALPGTFWAFAAKKVSLYVAAGWPDELIEELFATPIHTPAEVQRLIDAAETVLFLPDAHKMFVEVGA